MSERVITAKPKFTIVEGAGVVWHNLPAGAHWSFDGPRQLELLRCSYEFESACHEYNLDLRAYKRSWHTATNELFPCLPQCPALYAICQEGRVVYIGKTDNLRRRMTKHLRWEHDTCLWIRNHKAATIKFRIVPDGNTDIPELRLINRINPEYNLGGNRHRRDELKARHHLGLKRAYLEGRR